MAPQKDIVNLDGWTKHRAVKTGMAGKVTSSCSPDGFALMTDSDGYE